MKIENFNQQQFEKLFIDMIDGNIEDAEIRQNLIKINELNLPQEAFLAAVKVLKSKMIKVKAPTNSVDVCGTGGDKLNTLNISTAVAFVVASCGVSVAKHGNKAISSKSGSADIFMELGIEVSSDVKKIEKNLHEKKISFLFAPLFHESLKRISTIRKTINEPTIFNFLGPLINPADTKFQLIGTSRKDVMSKMINTIDKNKKVYIVHGFDGMDEISLSANSYILKLQDNKIQKEEIINPEDFGMKKVDLSELIGGDAKYNAKKLLELFEGEKSAYRDIVILNSAFCLELCELTKNIGDAIDLAKDAIDSKKTKKLLNNLQSFALN